MRPRFIIFAHRTTESPNLIEARVDKVWWSKLHMQTRRRTVAATTIDVGAADEGMALGVLLRELARAADDELI